MNLNLVFIVTVLEQEVTDEFHDDILNLFESVSQMLIAENDRNRTAIPI